ncbi:hypothetical protein F2P81_019440 [Scophthalmus maximus]|uniref:Uncharacterized protein n=1 Tax=Scophthalmus maximus TaxID=52904 RepID=A0A6A4S1X2_SCOMX|nr:hypothetical protein F2P81_019440 [Scophthalmus maximus]
MESTTFLRYDSASDLCPPGRPTGNGSPILATDKTREAGPLSITRYLHPPRPLDKDEPRSDLRAATATVQSGGMRLPLIVTDKSAPRRRRRVAFHTVGLENERENAVIFKEQPVRTDYLEHAGRNIIGQIRCRRERMAGSLTWQVSE